MIMSHVKEFFDLVENSNRICIVGHKSPDGDCIGSVMTLYTFLKDTDKNLTACFDGKIPYNYKSFVDESVITTEYEDKSFDLVIVVDCSDRDRLGKFGRVLDNTKHSVCIDHHVTNENFLDINIVDPQISSTGELIYSMLKSQNKEISKDMAEYMYISIVTDTGKFSYSNTSSQTHIAAADLMSKGIDILQISNQLYNAIPTNVIKAYIECISNVQLVYNNKLGIAKITQKNLTANNADMGDINGVVEFIREIREVEVACVLKETTNNHTKVSLRAKNDINVASISLKYGGGGHTKAAGFELNLGIDDAVDVIIQEFKLCLGE